MPANPAVTNFKSRSDHRERTTVLVVGGMHSAACVSRVEQALRAREGVETAGVNLLTRLATVRHATHIQPQELLSSVDAVGYQATLASPGPDARADFSFGDTMDVIASRKSRFVAGAIFTLLLLFIDQFWASTDNYKLLLLFLLATPVQITVGWDYYRGCIHALKKWSITLDTLVVLGSSAAYLQGFLCFIGEVSAMRHLMGEPHFHTAAVILTVVSLGKWLEARARESTRQLWGSLVDMTPREACVLRDGREQIIPAGVVAMGDLVLVRPHEKIPVDGEVVEGSSEVSESLFTGENRPVPKVKGDRVLVASENGSGLLRVRASGVGGNSTLAQISRMVADAQRNKATVEPMADRLSAIVVPVMLVLSAAAFVLWYFGPVAVQNTFLQSWISRDGLLSFLHQPHSLAAALRPALAVLVVACPAALGLAAPTAIVAATGKGARRGILIKGGAAIEAAASITDIVFDKTGILTDGSFRAQEVLTAPGVDREELLTLAASLEACSEHALAKGVVKEAKKTTVLLRKVDNFEPLPGRGLKGTIGKKSYLLGSRSLILERGYQLQGEFATRTDAAETAGATLIFLAEESGNLLGAIAMADRLKESAPEALRHLHAMGLKIHLLSGDNAGAARAVGRECGLAEEEVHAPMKLEDKADFASQLKRQQRLVAAVGDGINDAPALAAADVGLALGTGADIALESGQIVLVSSDVRGVPRALTLARKAARIIHWNLFWAFSLNAIFLPLAFLDQLSYFRSLGALVVAISCLLVVLNPLRLLYARIE